jgi:hypothetical protein
MVSPLDRSPGAPLIRAHAIDDPVAKARYRSCRVVWSRDGQRVERMLFAGNSLDRARAIFKAEIRRRPRGHYTIRQRSRVLDQWPPQD